jgi:hypothetical protein
VSECQERMRAAADAVANYLLHVLTDGDWLNDWATHVPDCGRDALIDIGLALATLVGR